MTPIPDEMVPDPQVAREFGGITLMTLYRWDRDPEMGALGWEGPIKIRKRNYRSRQMLEKVKTALRDVGIAAVRQAPRSNGARRHAPVPAETA
jgi:hypothetical protein